MTTTPTRTPAPHPATPQQQAPFLHSDELETAVLATLMNHPELMPEVLGLLPAEAFYTELHRTLWELMLRCHASGYATDPITLWREVSHRPDNRITQAEIVLIATQEVPGIELRRNALVLRDMHRRRRLLALVHGLLPLCYSLDRPIEEELAAFLTAVGHLLDEGPEGSATADFVNLRHSIREVMGIVEDNLLPATRHGGMTTGFDFIDQYGGLPRGGLSVLCGRPSNGKSALAALFALHAIEQGQRIAYFTLEMTRQQLTARLLSMKTGICSNAIMTRPLLEDSRRLLAQAAATYRASGADERLLFDGRFHARFEDIELAIRLLHRRRGGLDGVIIDYMQAARLPRQGRDDTETRLLGRMAHGLHDLAVELNIPILALSQFNRGAASDSQEPRMSDIRGSGEIEEAADTVLILHRPEVEGRTYAGEFAQVEPHGTALLALAKFRTGPAGIRRIIGFRADSTLFFPLANPPRIDSNASPRREYGLLFNQG